MSPADVTELGNTLSIPVFETSAKLRQNIDEAFFQIVREVKSMLFAFVYVYTSTCETFCGVHITHH